MTANVSHADLWGERQKKYDWLSGHAASDTGWTHLEPKTPSYWFVPRDIRLEAEYGAGWKITDAMPLNSVGIVTARDSLAIQFTESEMWTVVQTFAEMEPEKARSRFGLGPDAQDWKVKMAQQDANDGGPHQKLVLPVLYRPFDTRYTYFTGRSRGFICRPRPEVMLHMVAGPNVGLIACRQHSERSARWGLVGVADTAIESCAISNKTKEIGYVLPIYLYPKSAVPADKPRNYGDYSAEGRTSNYGPQFIADISTRLRMSFLPDGRGDLEKTFGPEDVFAYIYGVFHSPTYRTRYAEFLKIDFPRVPLTSNADLFRALCEKGQELVDLHLLRDERLASASFWGTSYPVAGKHDVTCVDYRPPGDTGSGEDRPLESGRIYINKKQPKKGIEAEFFDGVSPEVWEFRIGGYQVLHHWLKERKRHKRALTLEDIEHFQKVVAVLRETLRVMSEIDAKIDAHGGWPDAFNGKAPAR
ncbi:MAG TPA: type ISP restriction/modification enzyme [bacterium]|nr:type ISP restriction/modification enzyme [bacterium]